MSLSDTDTDSTVEDTLQDAIDIEDGIVNQQTQTDSPHGEDAVAGGSPDLMDMFAESSLMDDFDDIGGSGRLNKRTGQVQSFHARKGWGIIRDIHTNETFFVHHTGIQPQLPPIVEGWKACLYSGEYVEFVVAANPTKPDSLCAQCVTGINGGELMCDRAAWRVLFYRKNTEDGQSPTSPPYQKRKRQERR